MSLFSGMLLKRFRKNQEGAAAVEFAILAFPFFLLFMGILEVSLCYFFENALVTGMEKAVREVRVGTNFTISNFKTTACNAAAVIPDCENSLNVRLVQTTSFTSVTPTDVCDTGTGIDGAITEPETIVVAIGCFKWSIFTPLLQQFLQTNGNGQREIASAFAFRTEPFDE